MDTVSSIGWVAAFGAGFFHLTRAMLRRQLHPAAGAHRFDFRHEIQLMAAALNRIELAVEPIPSIRKALDAVTDDVRVLRGDVRRIDSDITDVRREISGMDDRIRRIERPLPHMGT